MRINTWNISLGEAEARAAYNSIMNRRLSEGIIVEELEKKLAAFLGRKYVICVPNGSSAILLAMMGIGIEPDDEVIIPDFTFIATGHAPKLLGAKVVLCDVKKDRPLIDIDAALRLITPKTKAIIPVHLNGRIADTKDLKKKLEGTGIHVIDDACQATASGGKGKYAGCDSDISCHSFAVTKIMTTAQGGFVTTDDEYLYKRMKKIKMQGMDNIFESNLYQLAGFNLKYTDVLASIGLVQLAKIEQKIESSKKNYQFYEEGLKGVEGIGFIDTQENEIIYTPDIICAHSKDIRKYLESEEVQVRPAGACLHKAKYFESVTDYPNAEYFEEHVLYMPGGPDQPEKNIREVIDLLKRK
ncbi:MAG: DegT/DnrJ/EryC1/StrS family aminotransferase [Ruminococcus flavefaciens]|nr:DegT/DnrJ/EryC1/StrS family aminotransferase [Ruminococcus flavefaciens]